jgi:maleylacetoacetate isomerase/maleylpyruvate isomerase
MKLYTFFRSSASFRVRIALNYKGLEYEPALVSLPKGEHLEAKYKAVNAAGLVPALEDGGRILTQSLAIIEYLDEAHPGPKLLPSDPIDRHYVRAFSQIVACEIHPLNNLRTLQHLKGALGQNEEQVNTWYRHWIADGLARLEADLNRGDGSSGSGRFCHGEAPTMADCCLVPQIFNAKRYGSDLAFYPKVMRVFDACMKLEAFDRAQPSKQPDAE